LGRRDGDLLVNKTSNNDQASKIYKGQSNIAGRNLKFLHEFNSPHIFVHHQRPMRCDIAAGHVHLVAAAAAADPTLKFLWSSGLSSLPPASVSSPGLHSRPAGAFSEKRTRLVNLQKTQTS
jgi:hypothetical protein